jgi:hypothetical protein
MSEDIIGEARDSDEIAKALRRRKAALGISDMELEFLADMSPGAVSKFLGAAPSKGLGAITLTKLLYALAVKFIIVEDKAAARRLARDWQPRDAIRVHPNERISKVTIARCRPAVIEELTRKAAEIRWANTSPEERAAIVAAMNKARANKRAKRRASTTRAA